MATSVRWLPPETKNFAFISQFVEIPHDSYIHAQFDAPIKALK